jgi:hypothetical protein
LALQTAWRYRSDCHPLRVIQCGARRNAVAGKVLAGAICVFFALHSALVFAALFSASALWYQWQRSRATL